MTYLSPGVYPDIDASIYPKIDDVVPRSPRRRFGFASPMLEDTSDKIITIESMESMSIDEIVNLYQNGYRVEENINNLSPNIVAAQGITVSTGALFLIGLGVVAYFAYKEGYFK